MSEELNQIPTEGQIEAQDLSFKVATTREELMDMVSGVGYIDGLSSQTINDAIKAGDIESMPKVFDLPEALQRIIENEVKDESAETVN